MKNHSDSRHEPDMQIEDVPGHEFPNEPDEVFYNRAGGAPRSEIESPHFQNGALPPGVELAGISPTFTEATVPSPILRGHMTPRRKCARLVVDSGALQFVWENDGETFDADPAHAVVIEPERKHHVKFTGPAAFHLEFYTLPHSPARPSSGVARPGEAFLSDAD